MIPGLSFGAPWLGLLALLAVPAIIAIHFLQLPSRPAAASTLFLLERLAPESRGGSRLQRLRNSLPLWLQLLAALVIAWLLSAPRWLQPDSLQTFVVVLDSSLSMRAFHDQLRLEERLKPLESTAARTEWHLMQSDPDAPSLYRGSDLAALAAAASEWTPHLGHHDPLPALRIARMLAPDSGAVLFVTDHPRDLALGVTVVGIGRPIENVGFSGVRVTPEGWEALIRNYGSQPQRREWWTGDATAPRQTVELGSGETQTVRGGFPESGKVEVVLGDTGEAFLIDNRLPLIRPVPKPLKLALPAAHTPLREWLAGFAASLPESEIVSDSPDLALTLYDPLAPTLPAGGSIIFIQNPASAARALGGQIAAENHPLMEGLNWQGLLATEGARIPLSEGDRPLLWQGNLPLAFLRGERLIVNFDPVYSNATRLPAFVLLLQRYTERIRRSLPVVESLNVETHQALPVTARSGELVQAPPSDSPRRAPSDPRFFTLSETVEGHEPALRLNAAAHFADSREADFRQAASTDPIPELAQTRKAQHSEQVTSSAPWLLLLLGLLMMNWAWQERRAHV